MIKEINIKNLIPDGFEIDYNKSTLDKIILIKKNKDNIERYEDIAKYLYYNKSAFSIENNNYITTEYITGNNYLSSFIFKNYNQFEKLASSNNLINCAIFFNRGWNPNWEDETEPKYYICYNYKTKKFEINETYNINCSFIYFRNKDDAIKTINLLGTKALNYYLNNGC